MRFFIVWIIFKKEILDTLRDKRTLAVVLLFPVIIYPVAVLGMSKLQGNQREAQRSKASEIALWGDLPADVERAFTEKNKIHFHKWVGATDAERALITAGHAPREPRDDSDPDARAADHYQRATDEAPLTAPIRSVLARADLDAVLVAWPDGGRYEKDGSIDVDVYVDETRDVSDLAALRVRRLVEHVRETTTIAREREHHLTPGFSRVARLEIIDTSLSEKRSGKLIGMMLPMLLMIMCMVGALMPAIDLTAGEKERGTLQTLLCAPVRAFEIMAGKFLTVWTLSLMMGFANVASMGLTLRRIMPEEIPVPAWTYFATFGLLFLPSCLFSALFISVAAFAKDFKDGQNLLMPVYLPCSLLASAALVPGLELDRGTALVPVVNVALLIRGIFQQTASAQLAFVVCFSTGMYAMLALMFAGRVFAKEEMLLDNRGSARAIFKRQFMQGGTLAPPPGAKGETAAPTPVLATGAFFLMYVAIFYGSTFLQSMTVLRQVLFTQLALFAAPILALAFVFRFPFRTTFAFYWPSLRVVGFCAIMGLTGWTLSSLTTLVLPPPPEMVAELEKALSLDGAPLVTMLIVLAFLPAVCEEIVFRGFIFAGFRRLGPWVGVIGTAVLFGVMHGSVYRFLPTFTLGVALGWIRLRTGSILPGIVVHAFNNALLLTVSRMKPELARSNVLPVWLYAVGIPLFAAAMYLTTRPGKEEKNTLRAPRVPQI